MFTGLIEDVGKVVAISPVAGGGGRMITIRTRLPIDEIELGASVAMDGVCLTAETFGADTFTVTAGRETLSLTTVGDWAPGRPVNLERALRVGDRLGGHLVAGHVDGLGRVERIEKTGESWVIWIQAPGDLSRYIATKGSVCLDGVSLTVNEVSARSSGDAFRVNIIPHTALETTLAGYQPGRKVNLEADLIARYLERLLEGRGGGGLTFERLAELGYK